MTAELGSVSTGTLRNEDLIPIFYSLLVDLGGDPDILDLAYDPDRATDEEYFNSEDAGWDVAALMDALSDHAPDGAYFGAHPGDGADFGFWTIDDE